MRTNVIAAIGAALVLTACQPHPPLRYVAVDARGYHDPLDDWRGSRAHRSWQRHQAEIRGDMRYHHGCYRDWC